MALVLAERGFQSRAEADRMQNDGTLLFSATDLVNFLGCQHAIFLDLRQLLSPIEVPPPDPHAELLQQKGLEHERSYLARLKAEGRSIVEINGELSAANRVDLTRQAMVGGAEVIYQGALLLPPWHGYADFLVRVDEPSKLGTWGYEVADTKLSRSAKPKHVIQLCTYSALVGHEQGRLPRIMRIVLGDGTEVPLSVTDFLYYFQLAQARFQAFCATPRSTSTGEPCGHCGICRWLARCEEDWEQSDHLSLVANIRRDQMMKLREAGIATMAALARMPNGLTVGNLQRDTLDRLRSQARLQVEKREDGQNRAEVLPRQSGKGFDRLPKPSEGDLFFDMEGDPLYEGDGLEYLFGFAHQEPGRDLAFTPFWAHSREEEKAAFERAMDFVVARLRQYPDAYIYHYGSYEETALKRLAMYHGTREAEVDDLLRRRKLVDLLKVVREAIRVSEPSYSIKNLEAFYLPEGRAGEVTTAGESIVVYERWRRLGLPELLEEIEAYNEADCRSTGMCRDWLLTLRPADAMWFSGPVVAATEEAKEAEREKKRLEAEEKMRSMTERLLAGVSDQDQPWRELIAHLLEFHRREAKPEWWAMFNRLEMSEEALIDDAECLGGLRRDPSHPPFPLKRSTVHSFTFPPQDFKMGVGATPLRADTGTPAGEVVALDDEAGTVSIKVGPDKTLPDELLLIPEGPIGDAVLRAAIYRYAASVAAGQANQYAAVTAILRHELPKLTGRDLGTVIIPAGADPLDAAVDAITRLKNSYMLVQGPPGTGKTYTSSHAIVELLRQGYRVGVSSLSHKAINNLLQSVEQVAGERRVRFRGVKKSSNDDHYLNGTGLIEDTTDNDYACNGGHQLIAGTAWLFARDDLDRAVDFLFIDEAGQVSLANVVAMGVCARNIVLVGDQMQLAQPIKGTHPGSSGLSALQYLLGDVATVPAERGIFLERTRRMNPDVCAFISDAVYDGRLKPEEENKNQRLVLRPDADEALAPTGLRFVEVLHEGCAQKSPEEAARIRGIYLSLMGQQWIDKKEVARRISTADVLVVTPYNMQVALLKSVLPAGARVGTVDKFQGQEAAVVLISMATSSGDDMPRNIEFLFSRNRLNVAISRARCLAVIMASPRLLEVPCNSIEQMRLVNTLCWARVYACETTLSVA